MATTCGHVLGPLLVAYLLIYQFMLSDPANNNSTYKFMATFIVQVFILLFCFYRLLKIINEYQERALDMIGSLQINQHHDSHYIRSEDDEKR